MGTCSRRTVGRQLRLTLTPQCLHFSAFIRDTKDSASKSAERPCYLMLRWVNKDVTARWIIKVTTRLNSLAAPCQSHEVMGRPRHLLTLSACCWARQMTLVKTAKTEIVICCRWCRTGGEQSGERAELSGPEIKPEVFWRVRADTCRSWSQQWRYIQPPSHQCTTALYEVNNSSRSSGDRSTGRPEPVLQAILEGRLIRKSTELILVTCDCGRGWGEGWVTSFFRKKR